uniref:Mitotic arrest deficient 2 like 2 n=1 Tax=Astyanax mexicanus TaxID=7994 RepID=A0A3B1KEZ7_ASTMX
PPLYTHKELNFTHTHTMVADILCEFLEVAIHLILYKRKKYNVPMSCHPELNQYIQDTLHCVKPLIEKNEAEKVGVVIMDKEHHPPPLLSISSETLLSHLEQLLRAVILRSVCVMPVLDNNPPRMLPFTVLVTPEKLATRNMEKVRFIKVRFSLDVADEQEPDAVSPDFIPLKTMTSDIVKERAHKSQPGTA